MDSRTNENTARNASTDSDPTRAGRDTVEPVIEVMSTMLHHTLVDSRARGDDLVRLSTRTIEGAVRGVTDAGGEAGDAARAIMLGTLRGVQRAGGAGLELVGGCAATLVRETYIMGGDVARAAKGAVEGAVHAARDLGIGAEEAAAAATAGALKAAGDIGITAVKQVRRILGGTVAGMRLPLEDPLRASRRHIA